MVITVELPPELEAYFVAEAKARGVSVSVVVQEHLLSRSGARSQPETDAERWEQQFRAWAAGHERGTPLLTEEAVSRESIYGG